MIALDTSAILALIDNDDPHHIEARTIWQQLPRGGDEVVIPNYVVSEALSLVSRRFGMEHARGTHGLMSMATSLWITPLEHAAAARRFLGSSRALSFVDCTTFTVMEVRGITTAFAFDENFTRAGFTLLAA